MPPSRWMQQALCKYPPTFKIKAEERDISIYAKDCQPACIDRRLKRIDMSTVDYKPTCKADRLFWDAAVDLYDTKIKFIPQNEAHIFVERCHETHVYKSYSSIWSHRIHRTLLAGSRNPGFADVIILSLVYGRDNLARREWYYRWSSKYKTAFKFPERIGALFSEGNLATEGFQPTKKRKRSTFSKETRTAANHVARKRTTKEKSFDTQTQLIDDERDDDEPWMEMYPTPATATSRSPLPQDSGDNRRQSAVDAEKRTQDLYKYYPVNQEQRKALRDSLGHQRDEAHVTPTLVLDDSDNDAGDVTDRNNHHEPDLGQSHSDPDIVEVIGPALDEESPMLGETDTHIVEGAFQSQSAATDHVQSDVLVAENAIGHATADELIQQLDEARASTESVAGPVLALNINEAHLEATFELLQDEQDKPSEQTSVSDLVQRCKDALAEEQKHILYVERLQEEVTARRDRTEELEKELAASSEDLKRLERELESACAKLASGRVRGV
ncbi:hypothetical protein LIA77_10406 [Sarocladium implicatum]|nr:hypothetical protein LIA77_10406 [Sarocladium implicatum]